MAKNTEYEFEETMVTLTDEDGIDKDFYVDEIYEVDGRLYAALIPGFVENITEYYVFRIKDLGNDDFELEDMVRIGFGGVVCVEAGGPTPGLGCAGRGIITALEKLKETGAYETYKPDIVLYDVLGDVVCGGFSMPMRKGYADKVFIITSGENMAIHAGANIAMAVQNFKNRGYASLGGIILNRRNVKREEEKVQELADDFETTVVGKLTRSELVTDAEEQGKTLMECYPDSEMAEEYRTLTENILKICREDGLC